MRFWEGHGMAARGASSEHRTPKKWLALPAAALAAAVCIVLWPGVFTITDVEFHGCGSVPRDSLKRVRALLVGKNLATASIAEARERLLDLPEVRDVAFKRRFRHTLECRLVKREPVALLVAGDLLEVDDEGVIIPRRSGNADVDLPMITGISQRELRAGAASQRVTRAIEVLTLFRDLGFSPAKQLSEIHVEGDNIDLVWMGTGTLVRLGRDEYANRVRKLRTVFGILNDREQFPQLIDLRFDRQVVIR